MNTDAHSKDVQDWAEAYVREARLDAAAVAYLVGAMGRADARPVALTRDNLLKLAAAARLHRWERTGLEPSLGTNLPTACEVLGDLLAPPGQSARYTGLDLITKVMYAHVTGAAWRRWPDTAGEVRIDQSASADQLLNSFAELLWQFRHLSRTP